MPISLNPKHRLYHSHGFGGVFQHPVNGGHFDVLAGVLFDDDFKVMKTTLIPIAFVIEQSTFVAHTNSNKFMLRDDVWNAPNVRDVTAEITAAMP